MGVDVAASGAFDRVRLQVFTEQQGLHFAEFQGTQYAPQAGDAAPVAARLAQSLGDEVAAAVALPPILNLLRVGANLVAGHVAQIRVEAADQGLADIGMQLGFEQGAVGIVAGENPFLEHALFQQLLHRLGDVLEVLASFVFNPALGVASVIAGVAIAAAAARQRMEQVVALGQLAQAKIEDAGAMPVDQHHTQQRRRAQQVGQGLEVEMAVDEKLRAGKAGGQLIFAPDVLSGAGEDSFAVRAIAAQFARQAHDALDVGAGAVFLALVSDWRSASRARSLIRMVSSLWALLRGVEG